MLKKCFFLICLSTIFANLLYAEESLPKKIVIVRDDVEYRPMEFYENGKLTGLHIETVNKIAQRLGIRAEWTDIPWKRALYMVEHGQADAITYISKTEERSEWAFFLPGNVLSKTIFSFLIRAESKNDIGFSGNMEELLKGKILLVISAFALPESIARINPKKYEAPRMENLVAMLVAKRYDIALVNKNDFFGSYKGTPEEKSLLFLEPPVHVFENYIAFSKKNNLSALAEIFSKEMISYKKTEEYRRLLQKYGVKPENP